MRQNLTGQRLLVSYQIEVPPEARKEINLCLDMRVPKLVNSSVHWAIILALPVQKNYVTSQISIVFGLLGVGVSHMKLIMN